MSKTERTHVFAAKWLYRWGLAQGIIGVVFSALTFVGVFTLVLGPLMTQMGLSYSITGALLFATVLTVVMAFGAFMDRRVKFWKAQTLVSTARNPFLLDQLYQKELLSIATISLPMLRALRELALSRAAIGKNVIADLDAAIQRLEETVENKRWSILPGEEAYEDTA